MESVNDYQYRFYDKQYGREFFTGFMEIVL